MTADFNAGSIEGTLDLDTRPFIAGLQKARTEAANFERQKITAHVGLDTTDLTAKKADADRKLAELDHKKVTAKADLDITGFLAKMSMVDAALRKSLDFGGAGKATMGGGMLVGKYTAIAGGLLSIVAAAGPAGAALLGVGAAASTAMGGAMASIGLFSAVAQSDFTKIQNAAKKGLDLGGPAGVAEKALGLVTRAWHSLQRETAGPVFGVMTAAFTGVSHILPRLVPLIDTTAHGIHGLVLDVMALTQQPIFAQFLNHLQAFMHGFLAGAGPVLNSLLAGFMHAFIVMQPLMAQLGQGITHLVDAGQHFAQGGGLKQFVEYVIHELPQVERLVSSLVDGLSHLAHGIAPLAGPALHFITSLVQAIGGLNLAPFARGFGEVLHAAEPLLGVLKTLINVVLTPLGHLLGGLSHTVLTPLAHSLNNELHPAFHALSQILNALEKPLEQFLGSIANLVNPTGVHLLATLLQMLVKPVQILAPAIGNLAVAFESVIDRGIQAITPLLPKLEPLLVNVAHGAASLANGLAAILEHKDVALALLAVIGAVKAGVVAFRVYTGIVKAAELAQAAYATAMLGSSAATEAGGLSMGIYVARLIATKTVALAVAAGQKAMAAAQWILNAALDANPIGIVITALAALAAGFVYAYKHSQTFRDIVKGALHDIEVVGQAVGHWFAGPFVDFFKGIAHWFAGPFVDFFKAVGHWFSGPFVNFFVDTWHLMQNGWHALSVAFQFVYNTIIKPIFEFYKAEVELVWNVAQRVWGLMQSAWHGLGNLMNDVWNHVIHPVFTFFKNAVGDVVNAFQHGVSAIETAWNRIKSVAEAPVRFVVGTVIDKGIIGTLNEVGKHFGLGNIPTVPIPFAKGSWVPGTSASDTADNVTARLTPGEFVVRRKAAANVEQKHPGALEHLNQTGELPKYGLGGWISGIGSDIAGAANASLDWAKNVASDLNPINFIKSHVESMLHSIGAGDFGNMVAGAGEHLLTSALDWAKKKIESFIPKGGGGGPVGAIGSGVQRWAPDVLRALAMLGQPASLLPAVLARMTQESGGNPSIVNRWDSNWAAGHPSVGLMQVIGPTFAAYAGPFRGTGPFEYGTSINPLANIYAGLNYALHAYGSIYSAMTKSGGYAAGTPGATPGWHRVGERGPELLRFRGGEQVLPSGATPADDTATLLRQIIALLSRKDKMDLDGLAAALDKHSEATIRKMLQIARAK